MNVIKVPWQMVVLFTDMLTDGVTDGETLILMALETAVGTVLQGEDEVISQVITSLLASVAEVKVAEFVPTLFPLIFH